MKFLPPLDATLAELLAAKANPTGGWGYIGGKASRLEPTSWALLALALAGATDLDRHQRFLLACQRSSGLLVEDPALPVNLAFNALSAVVMIRDRAAFGEAPVRRLLDAIALQAGQTAGPVPQFRQDNGLRGWPWVEGTFSWIEPTAWALIALKLARRVGLAPPNAGERISEAERLLIDRCCRDGGWNYGNSNAFGQELQPYVPTTALALLAMQDRRDASEVARSVTYLTAHYAEESSTLALALTAICFRRYAQALEDVTARLWRSVEFAKTRDDHHALAVACYAGSPISETGADVFAY